MGEDTHQVKRPLGLGVQIWPLSGDADGADGIVIVDRNAEPLAEPEIACTHHDAVRRRVALAIVGHVLPLERV